jgi:hypothetical protein
MWDRGGECADQESFILLSFWDTFCGLGSFDFSRQDASVGIIRIGSARLRLNTMNGPSRKTNFERIGDIRTDFNLASAASAAAERGAGLGPGDDGLDPSADPSTL